VFEASFHCFVFVFKCIGCGFGSVRRYSLCTVKNIFWMKHKVEINLIGVEYGYCN